MSFPYNTLESEEAKAAFKAAYGSAVLKNAVALTHSQQEAERLTAQVFKRMNQRYKTTPLPSGLDLLLLSQVNLIFAQGSYRREDEDASPAAPSTQTEHDKSTKPIKLTQSAPSAQQRAKEAPSSTSSSTLQPMKPMQPSQVMPSAHSVLSVPPAPTTPAGPKVIYPSAYSPQPSQPAPQPVISSAPGYPYVSTPYYPPATIPLQYGFQPIIMSAMPMVMMPYNSVPNVAYEPQQPVPAAVQEQPEQPSTQQPNKAQTAAYDASVTELWTPDQDEGSAEQAVTPVPQEPVAAKPAPPAEPAHTEPVATYFDEETDARSVPLTIFNTFLFVGLIGSIVFLLMQLNILPRLI